MISYDSFMDCKKEDRYVLAQLKCLACDGGVYGVGDDVPVQNFDFPKSCTFCDWGGTSNMFFGTDAMGAKKRMGRFVIIKDGKLAEVTEDESRIVYPVFDKYGNVLKRRH